MLPRSYCKKLQLICIELLLCYTNESVLAGVDLQNHYVAHHHCIIVDPLVVDDMQLVVGLPLDLRWSLVQDVVRVLQFSELVDDAAPAEWKTVLVEPCLVSRTQCLPLWEKETPGAGVGLKSEIDSF